MADLSSSPIIRLDKTHVAQAAHTLANAFRKTIPLQYYFPVQEEYERLAPYVMAAEIYTGLKYGEVYASSPNIEGVAVWIPSDHASIGVLSILQSVPFSVFFNLLRFGSLRLKDYDDYVNSVRHRVAPIKHMYLQVIGVDPQFQGQGYGGRLIRDMLPQLDAKRLPCYLETFNEKDVTFYTKYGFNVIDTSIVPGTNIPNWGLLRTVGSPTK